MNTVWRTRAQLGALLCLLAVGLVVISAYVSDYPCTVCGEHTWYYDLAVWSVGFFLLLGGGLINIWFLVTLNDSDEDSDTRVQDEEL